MAAESDEVSGKPVGRRLILGMLGLGAAGVVAGRQVSDGLAAVLGPIESNDPTGLVSLIPVGNGFRFYSVTGSVRHANPINYRLGVDGLVGAPAQHSLADLAALPQTTIVRDFQCVTGWRVPQVRWTGVLLSELISRAVPTPGATAVRFESFDGSYSESLTLEQARRADILVATGMLGGGVSHNHGGPVRLYVGPMYGYKSIKWLSKITLTARVQPGYWETRGYDVDGWVGRSNGRQDKPVG
jgi:DMSO/TMAO reductase YedYZ molybdopterin-dependent catalytic subunit